MKNFKKLLSVFLIFAIILGALASCAAGGLLLFQTCLNIFGPTDILPLTGVTLPFISSGGSSMISAWGLMAFLKAADERTYAAKRGSRRSAEEPEPEPAPAPAPRRRSTPAPQPAVQPVRRPAQIQHSVPRSQRRMQVNIPEEELAPDKHRSSRRKERDD